MKYRDRATGWKHAKLSGHKNEDLVKQLLDTTPEYAQRLLSRMGILDTKIQSTSIGGLHETNVTSVSGLRRTKSKTDLKLFLQNGNCINVSIKKSLGGQVYFVRAGLFIETFERQFKKKIPKDVVRAINLFWAAADDALNIIEKYSDKSNFKRYQLQIRHKSLNATTLKAYDINLYHALKHWFSENIYELTKLSFSMGAVKDKSEWSDFVWYINLLGEEELDEVFYIKDICSAAAGVAIQETYYGKENGGTTIQLPFGFVQWHQGQLQFHHKFNKIKLLIKS